MTEEAREVKRNLKRKKDKKVYFPAQIVKTQSMQGFYFEKKGKVNLT